MLHIYKSTHGQSRVLLFLLSLSLFAATTVHAADRWEPAIQKFEQQDQRTSPPQHGILFVGSSSIVGWDVDKFFPDLPVINRGFGGSQISDVIKYFDRIVTPYEPDTVVLYSGDNDITAGETTTTVINDARKFVALVHEHLPEARIVLIPPKPSISRWRHWPKMKKVGDAEKALAEADEQVIFLDIAPAMIGPDGKPRPELLKSDKLHMTNEGYVVWSDLLRPHLKQH